MSALPPKADMDIGIAQDYEKLANRAAKALGLDIPPLLQQRADELLE